MRRARLVSRAGAGGHYTIYSRSCKMREVYHRLQLKREVPVMRYPPEQTIIHGGYARMDLSNPARRAIRGYPAKLGFPGCELHRPRSEKLTPPRVPRWKAASLLPSPEGTEMPDVRLISVGGKTTGSCATEPSRPSKTNRGSLAAR